MCRVCLIHKYIKNRLRCKNKAKGMEMRRIELLTPCLQGRCSPSWATPPNFSWYCVKNNLPYNRTAYVVFSLPELKLLSPRVLVYIKINLIQTLYHYFGFKLGKFLHLRAFSWLCQAYTTHCPLGNRLLLAHCFAKCCRRLAFRVCVRNFYLVKIAGPKWTRTTDLTLIRRAL